MSADAEKESLGSRGALGPKPSAGISTPEFCLGSGENSKRIFALDKSPEHSV